jgi:hypothetical protein
MIISEDFARRHSSLSVPPSKKTPKGKVQLLSQLHTGHNFTSHIPNTADSTAAPLCHSITKYEWSPQKTSKHIAAHIQHCKFGREDYGYGFGGIELATRDVMAETTSTKWGLVPKHKPAEAPFFKTSEVDRFNPTDFEQHRVTFPVHTEELQV